jgi:hypothetical protein
LLVCYPQPGKHKAFAICEAFAAGVDDYKAIVCTSIPNRLLDGDAFFYGVREQHAHLWMQCKAEGRNYYYADNSYFDCARESRFRVTKNAIQHRGIGETDGLRFKSLGLQVKPMRWNGEHVLICEQSEEFMRVVAGDPDYFRRVTETVKAWGMKVLVRKKDTPRRFTDDLAGAKLLVTWSSAAAVGALLEGVRVAVGPYCCATHAGSNRKKWASVLADNEWTLEEMASGMAWNALR